MAKDKSAPRLVSPAAHARLRAATERRPVLALMGEFSAGKSTLLNMLVGQSVLPTQVTATKLPPVWLRHGSAAPYWLDRQGRRHPIALDALGKVPLHEARFIRVYCEAEVLESCDLLDTPGLSDPNLPMNLWQSVLGLVQGILWCTHAGQPWRESERAAFEGLPERLRRHSLLLVTRADKITSESDRQKIDARLEREAGGLFKDRLFLSLTQALSALEGEGNPELWAQSGAERLVEDLAETIAALGEARQALLPRYRIDRSAEAPVLPRRVRPAGHAEAEEAAPDYGSSGPSAEVIPLRAPRSEGESPAAPTAPAASGGGGSVLVLHNRVAPPPEAPAPAAEVAEAAPVAEADTLAPAAAALLSELIAAQGEAAAPDMAPAEPSTAPAPALGPISARWQAVLATRTVTSLEDVLAAIGAFAEALDAEGLGQDSAPAAPDADSPRGPGRRRRNSP